MSDLVEFIEARLAEDEATARAAVAGPWRYNPGKQWIDEPDVAVRSLLAGIGVRGEEYIGAGPIDATICVAATGPADDPQSMADAAFIARHDPARVLREVEAKRELLGLAQHLASWTDEHDAGVTEHEIRMMQVAAREMLWQLVTPYADHPDFNQEWTP